MKGEEIYYTVNAIRATGKTMKLDHCFIAYTMTNLGENKNILKFEKKI